MSFRRTPSTVASIPLVEGLHRRLTRMQRGLEEIYPSLNNSESLRKFLTNVKQDNRDAEVLLADLSREHSIRPDMMVCSRRNDTASRLEQRVKVNDPLYDRIIGNMQRGIAAALVMNDAGLQDELYRLRRDVEILKKENRELKDQNEGILGQFTEHKKEADESRRYDNEEIEILRTKVAQAYSGVPRQKPADGIIDKLNADNEIRELKVLVSELRATIETQKSHEKNSATSHEQSKKELRESQAETARFCKLFRAEEHRRRKDTNALEQQLTNVTNQMNSLAETNAELQKERAEMFDHVDTFTAICNTIRSRQGINHTSPNILRVASRDPTHNLSNQRRTSTATPSGANNDYYSMYGMRVADVPPPRVPRFEESNQYAGTTDRRVQHAQGNLEPNSHNMGGRTRELSRGLGSDDMNGSQGQNGQRGQSNSRPGAPGNISSRPAQNLPSRPSQVSQRPAQISQSRPSQFLQRPAQQFDKNGRVRIYGPTNFECDRYRINVPDGYHIVRCHVRHNTKIKQTKASAKATATAIATHYDGQADSGQATESQAAESQADSTQAHDNQVYGGLLLDNDDDEDDDDSSDEEGEHEEESRRMIE